MAIGGVGRVTRAIIASPLAYNRWFRRRCPLRFSPTSTRRSSRPSRCRMGRRSCSRAPAAQDARAHHAHRVAARDRQASPHGARRHLHEQGGARDAAAAVGAHADQRARHVDRHLPRPVQPDAARTTATRTCPSCSRSWTRRTSSLIKRMYKAHNLDDDRFPPRQLAWFISAAKRRDCARRSSQGSSRRQVEHYALYGRCASARRRRLPGDAGATSSGAERFDPQPLPAPLLAPARRRVPGHQPAPVQVAAASRRDRRRGVRRRRRRPVDLRVPGERGEHAAFRARLRRRSTGAASSSTELPVARPHPRRRERADSAQPRATGQELAGRERRARASRCARSPRRPTSTRPRSSSTWSRASRTKAFRCPRSRCSTAATRSRACSSTLFSAGLPYRVWGGMRFFERAEVKHARLPAARRAAEDDGAFLRVVNFRRAASARARSSNCRTSRAAAHEPVAGRCERCCRRQAGSNLAAFIGRSRRCAPDCVAAAARGGRARDRRRGPQGALRGREGRRGPHREPRGAGQHRATSCARPTSRAMHRCCPTASPTRRSPRTARPARAIRSPRSSRAALEAERDAEAEGRRRCSYDRALGEDSSSTRCS